jgi:hypothetical protein
MTNPISRFLFTATGAFAMWMIKGFEGPFDKEMVSIDERNSTKGTVRFFLGLGIWISIIVVAAAILTRQPKTKTYKARMNSKGEIELEETKTN